MIDWILGLSPRAASGWVTKAPGDDYWYEPRGADTSAGVAVDQESSLSLTTVWACVAKLSKTIATLPVRVYEADGDTRTAVEHPLNEILNGQAAEDGLTGLSLREALMANLLLWGNAYAEVAYRGGEVYQMQPLQSKWMVGRKEVEPGVWVYEYKDQGQSVKLLPAENVLRIVGLSLNGRNGLSVIGYCREAVALGLASQQFGASFFGNGATPGGFLKQPKDAPKMSPEAAERLIASFNEKFQGPAKAHGVALLREGIEFQQLSMPLEDAQFLETREFQRTEICSIFDVPPPMIQDYGRATWANIEHANIAWAQQSLLPWCVRVESAFRGKFFRGTRQYLKHNLAAIVRGDLNTRYAAYATGRQWGWLSVNDVRRNEDMDPVANGDVYLQPLNMVEAGTVLVPSEEPPPKAEHPALVEQSPPAAAVFEPPATDACRRVVKKETKAAAAAWARSAKSDKPAAAFLPWLAEFSREHEQFVRDAIEPSIRSAERAYGKPTVPQPAEIASDYVAGMVAELTEAVECGGDVPGLLNLWRATKAEELSAHVMRAITTLSERATP